MNYGDLNAALQRFLRWGSPNMQGMQELLKQILDQMFQGIKGSLQQMQGQDLSRVRDMVRELNKMLEQRMEGRTPDFNGFMQRFGDMFPPGINSLDELLEHLQRQMAQMQSLLQSMSPEAREQLRPIMDALLHDDSLRLAPARISGFIPAMEPPSDLSERSEEHTSELQSQSNLVCRLLLEKNK